MFGPWLLYVNDGSVSDAAARAGYEHKQWPYPWTGEAAYDDRGAVSGRLVLSDGRAASGAAVFLGDEDGSETNNQGEFYQYTTYAGDDGSFTFPSVRREKGYRLVAWANGGKIGDVFGLHNGTMVAWNGSVNVDLGQITWAVPKRDTLWQIGAFDKKTTGFKLSGGEYGKQYENGRSDLAPRNLVFSVGSDSDDEWYFAQTGQGNWTVIFDALPKNNRSATLSLSFAGSSSGAFGDPADLGPIPALNVSMNQNLVGVATSNNDKALYRSATVAGGWQYAEYQIPASMFLSDKANRLDL
jgi:rhamnogalacturonan endolyase